DIGPFSAIALHARQSEIVQSSVPTVLLGNDVVRFVWEECAQVGDQAVFAAGTGARSNGIAPLSGHSPAHARPEACSKTSALISATNRSTSHISSSSASSSGGNVPSRFR